MDSGARKAMALDWKACVHVRASMHAFVRTGDSTRSAGCCRCYAPRASAFHYVTSSRAHENMPFGWTFAAHLLCLLPCVSPGTENPLGIQNHPTLSPTANCQLRALCVLSCDCTMSLHARDKMRAKMRACVLVLSPSHPPSSLNFVHPALH